jgi:diguanylate cyclase (GGDEF)-like protein/PAS domain S-box-containing protein
MSGSAWLAGSPSSLLLFDGGVVVDVNEAACRELSRAREDLLGPGFVDSLVDEDRTTLGVSLGSLGEPDGAPVRPPLRVRRLRVDGDGPGHPAVSVIELRPVRSEIGVLADVRDVTEGRRVERIIDVLFTNVLILDATGTIVWRSAAHLDKLEPGTDTADVNALAFIHPDDLPDVLNEFGEVLADPGVPHTSKYRVHREFSDTAWSTARMIGVNHLDDPLIDGVVIATEALGESEVESIGRTASGFQSLAAGAPIGIVVTDPSGRSLYRNPLADQMLGLVPTMEGRAEWTRRMRPRDRLAVDALVQDGLRRQTGGTAVVTIDRFDGSEVWVRIDVLPQVNEQGDPFGLIATLIDVTSENVARQALQAAQAQLWRLANHDVLTGLPNRMQFNDHLERAFARRKRGGHGLAVLFCDVDNFKPVNDTHGHHVGDGVLVEVARRLDSASRESDTVFRIGGDEFVVVCDGFTDPAGLQQLAGRLIESVGRPIDVGQVGVDVGLSIGIAVATAEATAESLLVQADAALYSAKQLGRNRSVLVGDG